ncbi:MAG TPA: J domain-containing protein [Nevskiaceae bacterium]
MTDRPATHYETLKVAQDAPPEVIRAAYRALSQKHHPDRHAEDIHAERTMQFINAAYDVLSDPVRRRDYDRQMAGSESAASVSRTPSRAESTTSRRADPRSSTVRASRVAPAAKPAAARGGRYVRVVTLAGLIAIGGAAALTWAERGTVPASAAAQIDAVAAARLKVTAAGAAAPVSLPSADPGGATLQAARPWWSGLRGTFTGRLESAGVWTSVDTTWMGPVQVPFDGSYRYLEHGRLAAGALSGCRPEALRVVLCNWRDPFGYGNVRFAFDERLTAFTAHWGSGDASPEHAWTGERP